METRNPLACDQCHQQKLKCIPLPRGCARCTRMVISCTSNRMKKTRGRKPRSLPVGSGSRQPFDRAEITPGYAVLDCLFPNDADQMNTCVERDHLELPISRAMASRLLEHFYNSPEKDIHCNIIRKCNLLHHHHPRSTSPALLLAILCVACYMPTSAQCIEMLETNTVGFISVRRVLLSQLMGEFHKIILPERRLSLDDGITALLVSSFGPCEEAMHANQLYYLGFYKYAIKKLGLDVQYPDVSVEEQEERKRLWWVTYAIDRHASLALNSRPQFTDQECQGYLMPCPHDVWASDEPLSSHAVTSMDQSPAFSLRCTSLDPLGILIPVFGIIGEILEYHFLRQHCTIKLTSTCLKEIQTSIEVNLSVWLKTFRSCLPQPFFDSVTSTSDINAHTVLQYPTIAYYGLYFYHCLFVLLYGRMDLVLMYDDAEWQKSPDFIKAGEHALACTNVARFIMIADPHLYMFYRLFGTYIVQASFIFIMLARKLGTRSDQLIVDNCAINLQLLDVFVQSSNMGWQRDFAKALRDTLSRAVIDDPSPAFSSSLSLSPTHECVGTEADLLDPILLQYRWVAGYSGLWKPADASG